MFPPAMVLPPPYASLGRPGLSESVHYNLLVRVHSLRRQLKCCGNHVDPKGLTSRVICAEPSAFMWKFRLRCLPYFIKRQRVGRLRMVLFDFSAVSILPPTR